MLHRRRQTKQRDGMDTRKQPMAFILGETGCGIR